MIQFIYKKHGVQIEQQWFTGGNIKESKEHTQILMVHAIDEGNTEKRYLTRQNSLVTDLRETEEEIYGKFKKNTKYEIRRADREKAEYRACWGTEITNEMIDTFSKVFHQMYASKEIEKTYNYDVVRSCVDLNCIVFTTGYIENEPLVYHSYLYDGDNVRLYHSCSLFRDNKQEAQITGYLNRGLHWHDIKLFKTVGKKIYDWGGIENLDQPNGIDQFKLGFGGSPVVYYNAIIPVTTIGKGILLAKRLL